MCVCVCVCRNVLCNDDDDDDHGGCCWSYRYSYRILYCQLVVRFVLFVGVAESCVAIQRTDHEHDVDRGYVLRPSVVACTGAGVPRCHADRQRIYGGRREKIDQRSR